jgi:hypothetical protein
MFASTAMEPAEASYDWSVRVRRVDLVRVWSAPAELSARVTRRFDVAPGATPTTVHLEGDVSPVARDPATQVRVGLATRTTSTDPLARLLPVPAVLTYRAEQQGPVPSPGGRSVVSVATQVNGNGGDQEFGSFDGGRISIVMNPAASRAAMCRVGDDCPEVAIDITPLDGNSAAVGLRFHWSLDVTVYPFADVPVSVSGTLRSPATGG